MGRHPFWDAEVDGSARVPLGQPTIPAPDGIGPGGLKQAMLTAVQQTKARHRLLLSVVERYTEIPELTPCILHEFIEKIVVHAASDPKGKNRTQEIDIYYKGIGALEVSKVTSSRQE